MSNTHIQCTTINFVLALQCMTVFQDYVFPENVSFPLGGSGQPNKIMLEVHYDNPMRHAGLFIRSKYPHCIFDTDSQVLLTVLESSSTTLSRNHSTKPADSL